MSAAPVLRAVHHDGALAVVGWGLQRAEARLEPADGVGEVALHRALGHAHHVGHLRDREVVEVAQDDGRALLAADPRWSTTWRCVPLDDGSVSALDGDTGIGPSTYVPAELLGGEGPEADQASSTTISTSTGASIGSTATPTADRACTPASPRTSCSSRLAPLTTAG